MAASFPHSSCTDRTLSTQAQEWNAKVNSVEAKLLERMLTTEGRAGTRPFSLSVRHRLGSKLLAFE